MLITSKTVIIEKTPIHISGARIIKTHQHLPHFVLMFLFRNNGVVETLVLPDLTGSIASASRLLSKVVTGMYKTATHNMCDHKFTTAMPAWKMDEKSNNAKKSIDKV